ncbi:MAG: hypothetical protein ABIE22_00280 [archaeon]
MSEKDNVMTSKLKCSTIFDYKETYKFIYNMLVDMEYFIVEKRYDEKIMPEGKEVEIEWEAKRKISDYFRFILKLKWRVVKLVEVEVEENGKRKKMNKADLEIKISATIEKDYEHRWQNNPFTKFMRGLYDKFIIRGRIEMYEDKIFSEAEEVIAQAKAFLSLEGKR